MARENFPQERAGTDREDPKGAAKGKSLPFPTDSAPQTFSQAAHSRADLQDLLSVDGG